MQKLSTMTFGCCDCDLWHIYSSVHLLAQKIHRGQSIIPPTYTLSRENTTVWTYGADHTNRPCTVTVTQTHSPWHVKVIQGDPQLKLIHARLTDLSHWPSMFAMSTFVSTNRLEGRRGGRRGWFATTHLCCGFRKECDPHTLCSSRHHQARKGFKIMDFKGPCWGGGQGP